MIDEPAYFVQNGNNFHPLGVSLSSVIDTKKLTSRCFQDDFLLTKWNANTQIEIISVH